MCPLNYLSLPFFRKKKKNRKRYGRILKIEKGLLNVKNKYKPFGEIYIIIYRPMSENRTWYNLYTNWLPNCLLYISRIVVLVLAFPK